MGKDSVKWEKIEEPHLWLRTKAVGASPIWASDVRETPHELSLEEIKVIIGEYAEAVRRGKEAGLDSVQLHAAHGYSLIGSFMSPYFNKRTLMFYTSIIIPCALTYSK